MNKKDFVTLEIAKLLKEKGFNEPCNSWYNINGVIFNSGFKENHNNSFPKEYRISRPTLYQTQKWLREKHNCYVQITYEAYKTRVNYLVQVLFYEPNDDDCWSNKSTGKYGDNAEFDSFEDALSFGILEALKRIW
jgi:hypothetical protein|nr:MAG TPA: hypothetical protein [Bacteriophage sp.]